MASTKNSIFSKQLVNYGILLFGTLCILILLWVKFSYILSPLLMQIRIFWFGLFWKPISFIYELFFNDLNIMELREQHIEFVRNMGFSIYGYLQAIQKYQNAIDRGYVFTISEQIKAAYYFELHSWIWLFMAIFAYLLFRKLPKNLEAKNFTQNHTMQSLIQQERKQYPELYPIADLDFLNSSTTTGQLKSPLTEYEFVEHYNLLMDKKEQGAIHVDAFGKSFLKLNKDKTKKVLDSQLDNRFFKMQQMPAYRQAIFSLLGIMMLDNKTENISRLHNGKGKKTFKQVAMEKARELAYSIYNNKNKFDESFNEKWVSEYFNLFKDDPYFKEHIVNKHAFELTLLMSMLERAYNQQGVLNTTSLFSWLRWTDYMLFLSLNYVGRQNSSFIEVSGIVSHWIVEKTLEMPVVSKKTEAAIESLERSLYKYDNKN